MKENVEACSACGAKEIFRVPSLGFIPSPHRTSQVRTGQVVDDYIEETKRELKKEKKQLKKRGL